jgi:hypothetical protein
LATPLKRQSPWGISSDGGASCNMPDGSAQESIMRIESSNIANELIKSIESQEQRH